MTPRSVLLAAALAVLALPALAQAPAKCKLHQVAEWPVQLRGGHPIIEGFINNKKIGILLDTGAHSSLLTKSAAERLEINTRMTSEYMTGVGGDSRVLLARLDELRIGDAARKNWRVRVGGEQPIPGVDFILGGDFFRLVDLEFDYAKGVVRLFDPQDCKSAFLGYWDPKAIQVPMEDDNWIVVPIKVNGREARAMVDSGATTSIVALSFAAKLGITPQTPGVQPSQCATGLGAAVVRSWVARFDSVALGEENITDPNLRILDFFSDMQYAREAPPEVLLGADFLKTHRVFVSRSQRKFYFSYIGGLVFPATPSLDCEDQPVGKNAKEARKAYDAAIAANPKDVGALVRRSALRRHANDLDGALADVEAAIRLEPNNAVALGTRMEVRAARGDLEGALADSGAAIANGMRNAEIYVYRGGLWRSQGDCDRAIVEYEQALKLDAQYTPALRWRAICQFQVGRFESAEAGFGELQAIRPNGFDSIWQSLARGRRGLDARPVLEQGLAKLKPDEWPAPIMLFLAGRLDREALMSAASADAAKRKGQECEARFYMAEHFLGTGRSAEARPLLEAARDECPRNYIEYPAALFELAKLK